MGSRNQRIPNLLEAKISEIIALKDRVSFEPKIGWVGKTVPQGFNLGEVRVSQQEILYPSFCCQTLITV